MDDADKDMERDHIEFLEESASQDMELKDEEKALVRKIDLFLLPTIWIMYLLSYMDVSRKPLVEYQQC